MFISCKDLSSMSDVVASVGIARISCVWGGG